MGPASASATTDASEKWRAWYEQQRKRVDALLSTHLSRIKDSVGSHSRLPAAVDYSVTLPAKRVRPVLVLECARVAAGARCEDWEEDLDSRRPSDRAAAAIRAAIAVELVHTFTLIHDDLPAMDDDDLRRGHPTSHRVFGEGNAILAGDWLLAHALTLLVETAGTSLGARLAQVLGCGVRDVIAGQAADLAGEATPVQADLVRYVHEHKTARLIECACRLGAICGGAAAEQKQRLAAYGRHAGLAFQIADDLLDCGGTPDRMGKRARKDAAASKQTYPAAFGEAESRAAARREVASASAELEPFGALGRNLALLAEYMIQRDR
ncbi:MAG TPA: polyprenyl synthetase family protein [Phycisphaerae bacterium]|nr:polyprenyl synthetase family protein [Phycisphaerae bacterium]